MFRVKHHSETLTIQRSKSVGTDVAPAPKRMMHTLKTKTLSPAKLTDKIAAFGIFSRTRGSHDDGDQTEQISKSLRCQSQKRPDTSKPRAAWNVFNTFAAHKPGKRVPTEYEMFGGRAKADDDDEEDDASSNSSSTVTSPSRSHAYLKNFRSRMNRTTRQAAVPVLTRYNFMARMRHRPGTTRRDKAGLPSDEISDSTRTNSEEDAVGDGRDAALTASASNHSELPRAQQLPELQFANTVLDGHQSQPIDIPVVANDGRVKKSMVQTRESIDHLFNREVGVHDPDSSMLSTSPSLDVPAMPALRCPRTRASELKTEPSAEEDGEIEGETSLNSGSEMQQKPDSRDVTDPINRFGFRAISGYRQAGVRRTITPCVSQLKENDTFSTQSASIHEFKG